MANPLKFYASTAKNPLPPAPRNAVILEKDNWDDFGHTVQFHARYVDARGIDQILGVVKVLHHTRTSEVGDSIAVELSTRLPGEFTELGEDYISLGQNDAYYENMHKVFGSNAREVLNAMRDIAMLPGIAREFEPSTAFRNALLRENGARRARRVGSGLANGRGVREELFFLYRGSVARDSPAIETNFQFDSRDPVPGRIVAIIGRNAVGKTQFLASLGEDLAQISRSSADTLREKDLRFPDGPPLFTRVIAISYSAFDRFRRPKADRTISYVYCGIRSEKGQFSRSALTKNYEENKKRIKRSGGLVEWESYVHTILGDLSDSFIRNLDEDMLGLSDGAGGLDMLSSGQSILIHFVTALLAWIQPNSLVLFDEPETHLHPNAVASLFMVLSQILAKHDSYAILATHSPVVIQEIPRKRVIEFRREGSLTTAHVLGLESFGESVSELTSHVFETNEVDSPHRKVLAQLVQGRSAAQVMALFDGALSLRAQAYLLALYERKS